MVSLEDKKREWLEKVNQIKKQKEEQIKKLTEDKKKELEELEKKYSDELKEAEERIKEGMDDFEEVEEIITIFNQREDEEEDDLEEIVQAENVPETTEQQVTYQIPDAIQNFYEATNYNIYNELSSLLDRVEGGEYLSRQERETIYQVEDQLSKLEKEMQVDPLFLKQHDQNDYVSRSKNVLESIKQSMDRVAYKPGDSH